ncbi:hypothetical protein EJJ20_11015 [Pseudomonas poae]|nr:hypothetical protein EJJ20_11015 [Pseudomonas poae]
MTAVLLTFNQGLAAMKKTLFVLSALALLTACNKELKETPKPAPASVQATLVPECSFCPCPAHCLQ